ncbi:hypothetical protein MY11210_006683 [Beauveria gryllotalpidicola]
MANDSAPINDETGNAEAMERARLRRNQRNSRARKQAYTRDLENRWNECVKLGAQATVEMQAVARKVQQENILLRRILARQGFDQDTIQRALEIEKGMGEDYPRATSQASRGPHTGGNQTGRLGAKNSWPPAAQLPAQGIANYRLDDPSLGLDPDLPQPVDMQIWLRDLCDIKDAFSLDASHHFANQFWQDTAEESDATIFGNEPSSTQNGCNSLDLSSNDSATESISLQNT